MKGKNGRYCIICGKKKFRLFKSVNDYKIYECENCKLAYTDSSAVSSKERLEQAKNLYSLAEYKKEVKKHTKKFLKVLKFIKRYKKRGKLLDAGGGYGLFSKIALEKSKLHVEIVEPYLEPYYIGRENIKTHRVKLENFLVTTKRKYDVVVLLDVLEHFDDPDEIIEDVKKILNQRGIIVVSVPNYKSLMAYLSKKWAWWMVEDHKYHFSTESINNLMLKHQFKKRRVTTYESSSDLKKNLEGNFNDLPDPIKQISKLFILIPFMFFYNILKRVLWGLNMGGLTIGVYMNDEKK